MCKQCENKGRICLRCKKDLPRANLKVEGGAVCSPCARFYKAPEMCQQCGQLELRLTSIEVVEGKRKVCDRCWKKHNGHITCNICRKHRRPAGATTEGKPICKRCLEEGGRPFICPRCGNEGVRHSSTRCLNCYHRSAVEKRFQAGTQLLQNAWAKDAFISFESALLESVPPLTVLAKVNHYFLIFARLDSAFSRPEEITPGALLQTVGGLDALRRFSIPYSHLVKQGIIPEITRAHLADAAQTQRQDTILESVKIQWYGPMLRRFRDHLEAIRARYNRRGWKGEKARMKPRTISLNLNAALIFCKDLADAGVSMMSQVEPNHLDVFVKRHKGHTNGIRSFIRFINRKEKLFRPLKVQTVKRDLDKRMFLSRSKQEELLRQWLAPADDMLREALAGIFMLLYAQSIVRVVGLKLTDISMVSKRYSVLFGRTEVSLDTRVSSILARYLELRKSLSALEDVDTNPYLFPGRSYGGHLDEATVSEWLQRCGVRSSELFATAISNAYRSGLRHPKVLVNAFGITASTAIKYLNLIDPRMIDELHGTAIS